MADNEEVIIKVLKKKYRIDFWIGIGCATWTTAVIGTFMDFMHQII